MRQSRKDTEIRSTLISTTRDGRVVGYTKIVAGLRALLLEYMRRSQSTTNGCRFPRIWPRRFRDSARRHHTNFGNINDLPKMSKIYSLRSARSSASTCWPPSAHKQWPEGQENAEIAFPLTSHAPAWQRPTSVVSIVVIPLLAVFACSLQSICSWLSCRCARS